MKWAQPLGCDNRTLIDSGHNSTFHSFRHSAGGHILALCALLLIAAAARLYRLDQPSLWFDELRTLQVAIGRDFSWSKPLGQLPEWIILSASGVEISPEMESQPERWRAAGVDEWRARLPACTIGIITVGVLFVAGCRVLGPSVSLAACLLLALNLWHVYWSQTARFYALQFLFYNASLLAYLRWMRTHRAAPAVAAMVLLVAAAMSQPTAVVLYGVFILDSLCRSFSSENRASARRVLAALLAPAILTSVGIGVHVLRDPGAWSHFFEKANLGPGRLFLSGGYFIGLPVVVTALFATWRIFKDRDADGITLVLAAIVPLAAFSIVGLFGRVELRYCLVCAFAWVCLAGRACVSERIGSSTPTKAAFSCAVLAAMLAAEATSLYDYYQANGLRPYTREAVAYVKKQRAAGERIFMDELEGAYYFGEPVAGDPRSAADDCNSGSAPAWVIYRTDWRGTKPAPADWAERFTELRRVFGEDGIGRMARVYVRYRPRPCAPLY